jgi:hypothetical protein
MALIACVHAAWRLRTPPAHEAGIGHHLAKHEVEFATCFDPEVDLGMVEAMLFWNKFGDRDCKIHWIAGDQRDCISVGGKWNRILKSSVGQTCDVITFLGDKTIPITRDWDSIIGHNVEERPNDIMWWYYINTLVGQVCCCIPIITRPFLDACDRAGLPLVSDMYPYWQVDGWLEELGVLIQGNHVFLPIEAAGLRGRTTNCRDVKFWNNIYAAAGKERIDQATAICRELYGKDPSEHNPEYDIYKQLVIDRCRTAPHIHAMVNDEQVIDLNPPSEGYLTLKKEAEIKYAVQLQQMAAKVEEVDRLKMAEMGIDISDPTQVRQYLDL